MAFIKLPSNSERLLLELVRAENASQALQAKYEEISVKERDELDGIVRELKAYGYINAKWADNIPFIVTLSNAARTYSEQLAEYEAQRKLLSETKGKPMVFISHRSTDKAIADMLVDFFVGTGISKAAVFCSSLPGNDINEKISAEVKAALKESALNIAILSRDYYQSAYCLNEAGVLWYRDDVKVVPIALPEIDSSNMYGFLNNEYKLRRLDCDTDIAYIYDQVSDAVSSNPCKAITFAAESQKLKERYSKYLGTRKEPEEKSLPVTVDGITTDDERIVLYYMLSKSVRKVTKAEIRDWLYVNEIYDVNIDNAFDLLSTFDGGSITGFTLEFGIDVFRKYSSNADTVLVELKKCVNRYTKRAADTFERLWNTGLIDSPTCLFVAYLVDERIHTLGDRWMATAQIQDIKGWEDKYQLNSTLSDHYGSCLGFFQQNNLVYPSGWTREDNPREFTLCPSFEKLLFNHTEKYCTELRSVKEKHTLRLPF